MEKFLIGQDERFLGLDYGSKYVGVAVSDPLFLSAQGLEVIYRKKPDKQRATFRRINEIIDVMNIGAIVIGLPKNMDGSENDRCIYTYDFADELYKKFNLPIYMVDERLTSISASRTLDMLGKKDTKEYIDEISAMLILQSFLDSLANNIQPLVYKG